MNYCRRCKATEAAVTAYWGDPLCRPCARHVADLLDSTDRWPAVPWNDTDQELIS